MVTITERVQGKFNKHLTEIDELLTDWLHNVGKEWQRNHPKRKLRFMDGMGTNFWVLDEEIVDERKYIDERKQKVLEPLLAAWEEYNDVIWCGGRQIYGIYESKIKFGYGE